MARITKEYVRSDDPLDNRRSTIPGSSSVKLVTEGSAGVRHQAQAEANNTDTQKKRFATRLPHRVAAWNVRGLLEDGKLSIVEKEMDRHHVAILGLSETHMRGSGHYQTAEGNTIYCSGNGTESINGVAVIVPKKFNDCVLGYKPVNDRIMTVKIDCKPLALNIVQAYAPTTQSTETDIDSFYGVLEDTIKALPRREMLLVQGDWNAKIGDTTGDDHIRNVVGKYGLAVRNDRGEKFIEFCIANKLTVTNTCFKNHIRRLYTWKSPGDRYRNQIDFIAIDQRWRSSVINAKTFPGADCNSDHQLVVAEIRIRFKCPRKLDNKPVKLKKPESEIFKNLTENAFLNITQVQPGDTEQQWNMLKREMKQAVDNIAKQRKHFHRKKNWISEETWDVIMSRKEVKANASKKPPVSKSKNITVSAVIFKDSVDATKTVISVVFALKLKSTPRNTKQQTFLGK